MPREILAFDLERHGLKPCSRFNISIANEAKQRMYDQRVLDHCVDLRI